MKIDLVEMILVLAILALLSVGIVFAARAEEPPHDYREGEQSAALVSPELQSAAAQMLGDEGAAMLLHAAQLQMTKYDRDMKTPAGRTSWHGKLIKEEVYPEQGIKIEVYSNDVNGAVWRYRTTYKPVAVKPTTRKTTYTTNGIPARLAAARAKRAAAIDAGPISTNVVINANK